MGRKSSGKPLVHRCQKLQKNGDTYVYERVRILKPDKSGYNETRRLLGILPPGSTDLFGTLLPTRPKRKAGMLSDPSEIRSVEPRCSRSRTGMIDIIKFISRTSKIEEILYDALPKEEGLARKILTCAWYNFASDGDTWPGIKNWTTKYQGLMPYPYEPISKDMYHDLFVELGKREDIRFHLFRKLADHLTEESMLALDSSTFETESEQLANVRKAPHKDGLIKNTYKVVFLYAIDYRRPVAYALIPGNIPDSETVSNALLQVESLRLQNIEIVSDNGYCTAASVAVYLENKQSFLTRIEADTKWISLLVEKHRDELEHGGDILSCDPKFSGCMETVRHTFQRQLTKSGVRETKSITEEVNVFIYFSSVNKAKDDVFFRTKYNICKEDLMLGRYLGKDKKAIEKFAKKYMLIERDSNGNITNITPNRAECAKRLKYSGFLVLLSNKECDAESALVRFRKREYIEEDIKNFKGHTGGKKPRVWSDDTLDGEILVQFLSLILHETFELRIQNMKTNLAQLNGDPDHDAPEVLDVERQLLSFLQKTSLHDQLHWFDAIMTREYMQEDGASAWAITTETTKRDRMYLEMLGLSV